MSPAYILEPTYHELKRRLTNGVWRAGFRLDTGRLAADLGVSKSPVRDSLNRLAGERLVDFSPGDGFHVPRIDEQQLRDLIDLNLSLLIAAIDRPSFVWPVLRPQVEESDARQTVSLDWRMVPETASWYWRFKGLNDRLAAVRRLDGIVLGDPAADLDDLDDALSSAPSRAELHAILRRYHERRGTEAPHYVHLLKAGSV